MESSQRRTTKPHEKNSCTAAPRPSGPHRRIDLLRWVIVALGLRVVTQAPTTGAFVGDPLVAHMVEEATARRWVQLVAPMRFGKVERSAGTRSARKFPVPSDSPLFRRLLAKVDGRLLSGLL